MGAFEFLACLIVSLVTVTLRRVRHGPLLPTWSWGYEFITASQKRFHGRVARRSPEDERRAWAALRSRGSGLRRVHQRSETLGSIRTLWYAPRDGTATDTIVLYLHGGGFTYGSERSHGEICAKLALASAARVALLDYRLSPEHQFPAAIEDAVAAYTALTEGGTPPHRIIVAGDSAGGNLALSLLIALREREMELPAGAALISPWVDLNVRGGSMVRNEPYEWASPWMFDRWCSHYLGSAAPSGWLASPGLADLKGLPAIFVTVGTAEMLYDQVASLVEKAQAAGVDVTFEPVQNRVHMWIALADIFPSFRDTFALVGNFIQAKTSIQHEVATEVSGGSRPEVDRQVD